MLKGTYKVICMYIILCMYKDHTKCFIFNIKGNIFVNFVCQLSLEIPFLPGGLDTCLVSLPLVLLPL